jgi:hypothetical protein
MALSNALSLAFGSLADGARQLLFNVLRNQIVIEPRAPAGALLGDQQLDRRLWRMGWLGLGRSTASVNHQSSSSPQPSRGWCGWLTTTVTHRLYVLTATWNNLASSFCKFCLFCSSSLLKNLERGAFSVFFRVSGLGGGGMFACGNIFSHCERPRTTLSAVWECGSDCKRSD